MQVMSFIEQTAGLTGEIKNNKAARTIIGNLPGASFLENIQRWCLCLEEASSANWHGQLCFFTYCDLQQNVSIHMLFSHVINDSENLEHSARIGKINGKRESLWLFRIITCCLPLSIFSVNLSNSSHNVANKCWLPLSNICDKSFWLLSLFAKSIVSILQWNQISVNLGDYFFPRLLFVRRAVVA